MNIFETKINYIISTITAILSAIFGDFWFLFVFLLGLNIIDYVTGILKARYLKQEKTKNKRVCKKISFMVFSSYGLWTRYNL